jgi:imidazolonepropionase-like amidohydrolase
MTSQGIMENADVLVTRGRVARVGRNLAAPAGAVVINGAGKHVTPGLIDAHLHSGASGGINETGSAIVPEVRIADVITMDNIWMYRQLAGGLTTAHVMHGSANPIGGQNQVVKLRWGALPSEQIFAGAPRTVKFALGENPKRREERYPDTRMGTEQIIRDHFLAAREYERAHKAWETNKRGIPPRKDLRMQALVDIMNGDILVMSHAYRQDEMLMLMRIAEEFGFRIKAFHHGVEAYKLGPEMAAHGAAAVVWSDWGAFKMEAFDNTTYNARLLRDAGVLTSLHSDNSQIASRMNWEAAKMLRTGLTEQEALALVTINTAKVLGIDSRVGSLDTDKDADFVVWSANPLSTEAKAEQTWIDGRKYYDIEEDRRQREEVARERSRLIQLILQQR